MALERFIPKSPDMFIRNSQDFEVAKFGHLNTIVEYINNNSAKPAGLNGYVQFNDNAALGADADLFWDNTNKYLGIGNTTPAYQLSLSKQLYTQKGAYLAIDGGTTSGVGNYVGIGTTSPTAILHLVYTYGQVVRNQRVGDALNGAPTYENFKSGGVPSALTAVLANTNLGQYTWRGSTSATTSGLGARLQTWSLENFTTSAWGSRLDISVTSLGTTSEVVMMNLRGTGVNIGNATADLGARLGVKGSGSTSATTALLVQNSSASTALQIQDNLGIIFPGKGQDSAGVYIGRNVAASWTNSGGSVVIGDAADVAGNAINQVIIGKEAIGGASNNINIGYRAGVLGASNGSGILIGNQAGQHGATNYPTNPIGIGSSVGVGTNSISIGTSAKTTGVNNSIAIGNASEVYFNPSYGGINAIALGANSFANTIGVLPDGTAIAIGYDAYANSYEFVSGAPTFPIKDVYFGSGVIRKNGLSTGVGVAYTINGSGAFGTNFAGGNLTLAGGKGTGTGTAGNVIFSTSTATTSGTTLQTLSERMRIDGSGNVGIGTTTPTQKLDVNGVSRFRDLLNIDNNKSLAFAYVGGTTGFTILNSSTNQFQINNANYGYNLITIPDSASSTAAVGIGTTTPTAKLQVKGNGATSGTTSLLVQNSAGSAVLTAKDDLSLVINDWSSQKITFTSVADNYSQIDFGNTLDTRRAFIRGGRNAQYLFIGFPDFPNIGTTFTPTLVSIGRSKDAPTPLRVNGTPAFSITDEAVIQVNGGLNSTNSGAKLAFLCGDDNADSPVDSGGILVLKTNTFGTGTNTRMIFYNRQLTTLVERMRIADSGNLLVGTTTDIPSSKLTISSTTQGFLPPRMTTAERVAITSPVNGLIVFDTDVQNLCYRRDGVWVQATYAAV